MEENQLFLKEKPVFPLLLSMAVPVMLSMLINSLYNIVDSIWVAKLGTDAITAVSLAFPLQNIIMALGVGLGVGASSLISMSLGAGKREHADHLASAGLLLALIHCLVFIAAGIFITRPFLQMFTNDPQILDWACSYTFIVLCVSFGQILQMYMEKLFQGVGKMKTTMYLMASGCIINIILDPIFIMPWGFNMGAAGAGLATFLSNCVACLYFLVLLYIKRRTTCICLNPKKFSFDRTIAADIFGVGIPAAIQNLLNVTSMTVYNNSAAAYGSEVVAAMGIVQKIQMVPMQVTLGAVQGIMPFVGYNFANHNYERMRKSILYLLKRMILLMVVIVIAGSIFSGSLVGLFIKTDTVVHYGAALLPGFLLALPFMCVDYMCVSVFQAIGDGKKSFYLAFLRKIVLEIPALVLLNYFVPLYGMSYATLCTEVILAVLSVKLLHKVIKLK